ncbi:hypothetical protein BU15DRAFT_13534, partial [Melanogaster broomeanus]
APERRTGNRDLRTIPNEIYLTILEDIAPTSGKLSPEQVEIFINLSLVCRLFGNLCLPRVFEYVEFVFGARIPLPVRGDSASRGSTLCHHIAAKEPLALALAQCVGVCHLTNWRRGRDGWPGLRTLSQIYLTGMARMKNIRKVGILYSNVEIALWDVIATLESL